MKYSVHHNLLLMSFILILLTGCAAYNAQKVGPTTMMKAQEEIFEEQLLDVGIFVFESDEITENQAKEEHTSQEIRKAERHFMPYHLKNTLQQSSYWGAVRVLPGKTESIDVLVKGKVLESNGANLILQIDVMDATRKNWFSKKYKSEATLSFYSGNRAGEKDAYQDLYNIISNDMAVYFMKLPPEEIKKIRTVSKLKFAQDFAPSVYNGYLTKDKKNLIAVNRLPADEDTIMIRLLKIREREYMYVDTLNEYYEKYYEKMWSSYENWRKLNYEEIKAIKKIERNALMQKLTGILLMAGAIALNAGEVKNTGALQLSMILIGGQVIINGFNVTKEAEIHSAAIKELSESFGSEMQPVVMEFEGKQYELTGSAEEQFKHWRELLRQIYITETGFNPDITLEHREKITSEDSK
ncbi:MAG: hypothetical protein BMS9Abin03_391 [Thermodesulfobacteriota bacterium]|nr:MAG: hypothetical protein BMS9Abin03_391 [Thermodesulfobacteriota bacterium]